MASAEKQIPTSPQLNYAPRWRRLVAQMIDGFLFTPVNLLLIYILKNEMFINLVILYSVITIYYIGLVASPWQATLGKRIMKIYVTTKQGGKPSLGRVTGRYAMFMVPCLPALVPSLYMNYLTPRELADKVNAMHFQFKHELVFTFYAYVAAILLSVAVLLLIWYVPIFFTKQRKTLYDMVCGTRVVSGKLVSLPKE